MMQATMDKKRQEEGEKPKWEMDEKEKLQGPDEHNLKGIERDRYLIPKSSMHTGPLACLANSNLKWVVAEAYQKAKGWRSALANRC